MPDSDPRPTQTRVKHEILRQYLQTWGGIISFGLKSRLDKFSESATSNSFYSKFVYVDCFASEGIYQRENGTLVYGSPIIGVEELDKLKLLFANSGLRIETQVILIEKEKDKYQTLLKTLNNAGYTSRVVENADLNTLKSGQIAVYQGDYHAYIDNLLAFTGKAYTWSLYFLDPYGPTGIDLKTVSRVITQQRTDAIIYYPYLEVQKKTGSIEFDHPGHKHHKHLQHIDAMYGSDSWRGLVWANISDGMEAMLNVAELYEEVLQGVDTELAVKRIPLLFEDKERPLYILFLTTHDGTGALKMNEILDNAVIRQFDYRQQKRLAQTGSQFSLFSDKEMKDLAATDPKRPTLPRVDLERLMHELAAQFSGKNLSFRGLLKRVANTPYYVDDIRKALEQLRKGSKAQFEPPLKHSTLIQFL